MTSGIHWYIFSYTSSGAPGQGRIHPAKALFGGTMRPHFPSVAASGASSVPKTVGRRHHFLNEWEAEHHI
jgi:hypothetical protein